MYARIATFEGGDDQRLRQLNEERMQSGEMQAPDGMKHVTMLSDGNRRLFIAYFDSREQLEAAEEQFDKMGDTIPEDVRGQRKSVDVYEVTFDDNV
jgi:hypothetical protein